MAREGFGFWIRRTRNFQVFDEVGNLLSTIPLPSDVYNPLGFGLGADGSLDLDDTNGGFLKKFLPCGTVPTPTPTFTPQATPCLTAVDGWVQGSNADFLPRAVAVCLTAAWR